MKIILTLLLLLFISTAAFADDIIYDKAYGGKKIGRVKDGKVYNKPYGGKKVGRIEESGKLYDAPYGGKSIGRYKDGKVYDKPYGGKAIGRTDNKEGNVKGNLERLSLDFYLIVQFFCQYLLVTALRT